MDSKSYGERLRYLQSRTLQERWSVEITLHDFSDVTIGLEGKGGERTAPGDTIQGVTSE